MANQPNDREVINLRERPLSTDINLAASYATQALRELAACSFASRNVLVDDGSLIQPPLNKAAFFGSGFRVRKTNPLSMAVVLDAGCGYFNDGLLDANIGGVSGLDDRSILKPLTLTANETITPVPASDPVNPRLDIVEVKVDRRLADPSSRDIWNPGTLSFLPAMVNKTLTYNQNGRSTINGAGSINYKTGTPAAVPVAPTVTAGYVKIAQVRVGAATATIPENAIADFRRLLVSGGIIQVMSEVLLGPGAAANLVSLVAPAGVSATWVPITNTTGDFYIIAGDSSAFASLTQRSLILHQSPSGGGPNTISSALNNMIAVDAALQALILATGSPPLSVAIGQNVVWHRITTGSVIATNRFFINALLQYGT